MRPRQWLKNLLLFAGIIFSHNCGNGTLALRAFAGFCLFCLLSGAVYILNDLQDTEADRLHPRKKNRPLAARLVKRRTAFYWAMILTAIGLGFSFLLSASFGLAAMAYYVLTLLYSHIFKHVAIVDVILLASGFVLRAIAGVVVIRVSNGPAVPMTPWFVICILFLALFVAICKRRHELTSMEEAANHRRVLEEYSPAFLDQMISVSSSATIISYALYLVAGPHGGVFEPTQDLRLLSTLPFVIYGVFRYLYLVYKRGEGGEPETLILKDKPFLANVLFWLVLMVYLLP
jgi:4-hydroxybenzoate polyprenyltransferase